MGGASECEQEFAARVRVGIQAGGCPGSLVLMVFSGKGLKFLVQRCGLDSVSRPLGAKEGLFFFLKAEM